MREQEIVVRDTTSDTAKWLSARLQTTSTVSYRISPPSEELHPTDRVIFIIGNPRDLTNAIESVRQYKLGSYRFVSLSTSPLGSTHDLVRNLRADVSLALGHLNSVRELGEDLVKDRDSKMAEIEAIQQKIEPKEKRLAEIKAVIQRLETGKSSDPYSFAENADINTLDTYFPDNDIKTVTTNSALLMKLDRIYPSTKRSEEERELREFREKQAQLSREHDALYYQSVSEPLDLLSQELAFTLSTEKQLARATAAEMGKKSELFNGLKNAIDAFKKFIESNPTDQDIYDNERQLRELRDNLISKLSAFIRAVGVGYGTSQLTELKDLLAPLEEQLGKRFSDYSFLSIAHLEQDIERLPAAFQKDKPSSASPATPKRTRTVREQRQPSVSSMPKEEPVVPRTPIEKEPIKEQKAQPPIISEETLKKIKLSMGHLLLVLDQVPIERREIENQFDDALAKKFQENTEILKIDLKTKAFSPTSQLGTALKIAYGNPSEPNLQTVLAYANKWRENAIKIQPPPSDMASDKKEVKNFVDKIGSYFYGQPPVKLPEAPPETKYAEMRDIKRLTPAELETRWLRSIPESERSDDIKKISTPVSAYKAEPNVNKLRIIVSQTSEWLKANDLIFGYRPHYRDVQQLHHMALHDLCNMENKFREFIMQPDPAQQVEQSLKRALESLEKALLTTAKSESNSGGINEMMEIFKTLNKRKAGERGDPLAVFLKLQDIGYERTKDFEHNWTSRAGHFFSSLVGKHRGREAWAHELYNELKNPHLIRPKDVAEFNQALEKFNQFLDTLPAKICEERGEKPPEIPIPRA